MHEMKLRVQVLRPALASGARAEPCHWSERRHNYVGVSLQEIRAKSNARGATAGKMGRNSSNNNNTENFYDAKIFTGVSKQTYLANEIVSLP